MKQYPFIKCLHPSRIFNRYTGEFVLVECGKCEHCLMKKSIASTTRCKLESCYHKYTYFVTLTYANEHLPCARLVQNADTDLGDGESYLVVREADGLVLGNVVYPSNIHKNNLVKKCKAGHNRIPVLYSYHAQLFLKRLRKRINNEKIRTFYCGEYGPKSYRPHFHFLIWFDQEQTLSSIRKVIHSSWTYGRIDSSLASGKASGYVASYLNCSCYLPKVLTLPTTKPFANHSWYLGEQLFKSPIEEIQKTPYESIISKRMFFNGINTDVLLWRSLKSRLFPKFKGFASQSEHLRALTYSAYAKIREWTKETSPICQARFITDYVRYLDFYHENDGINELLQLFRQGINVYSISQKGDIKLVKPALVDYDKFERMVYKMILNSRYFLKYICAGDDSYNNVCNKLRWIEGFYDYYDAKCLKEQLEVEKYHSKRDDIDLEFFYHNILSPKRLTESRLFKRHRTNTIGLYSNFIKHKELNDLNRIFNY